MCVLYRLDQKNREMVGETEGLMEEIRLLNQDLADRDGRIDKLNQVWPTSLEMTTPSPAGYLHPKMTDYDLVWLVVAP